MAKVNIPTKHSFLEFLAGEIIYDEDHNYFIVTDENTAVSLQYGTVIEFDEEEPFYRLNGKLTLENNT